MRKLAAVITFIGVPFFAIMMLLASLAVNGINLLPMTIMRLLSQILVVTLPVLLIAVIMQIRYLLGDDDIQRTLRNQSTWVARHEWVIDSMAWSDDLVGLFLRNDKKQWHELYFRKEHLDFGLVHDLSAGDRLGFLVVKVRMPGGGGGAEHLRVKKL